MAPESRAGSAFDPDAELSALRSGAPGRGAADGSVQHEPAVAPSGGVGGCGRGRREAAHAVRVGQRLRRPWGDGDSRTRARAIGRRDAWRPSSCGDQSCVLEAPTRWQPGCNRTVDSARAAAVPDRRGRAGRIHRRAARSAHGHLGSQHDVPARITELSQLGVAAGVGTARARRHARERSADRPDSRDEHRGRAGLRRQEPKPARRRTGNRSVPWRDGNLRHSSRVRRSASGARGNRGCGAADRLLQRRKSAPRARRRPQSRDDAARVDRCGPGALAAAGPGRIERAHAGGNRCSASCVPWPPSRSSSAC